MLLVGDLCAWKAQIFPDGSEATVTAMAVPAEEKLEGDFAAFEANFEFNDDSHLIGVEGVEEFVGAKVDLGVINSADANPTKNIARFSGPSFKWTLQSSMKPKKSNVTPLTQK
jgi:hypothetical protein